MESQGIKNCHSKYGIQTFYAFYIEFLDAEFNGIEYSDAVVYHVEWFKCEFYTPPPKKR